jgi:hypothetical protein
MRARSRRENRSCSECIGCLPPYKKKRPLGQHPAVSTYVYGATGVNHTGDIKNNALLPDKAFDRDRYPVQM